MPRQVDEVSQVAAGLFGWNCYDPAVKADLSSTALMTSRGIVVVDPINLSAEALALLTSQAPIGAIVLTNCNHDRDAAEFAKKFSAPIFACRARPATVGSISITPVADGEKLTEDLTVVALPGAGEGEIALHDTRSESVVIGDALINFGPHGFDFLPAKYCSDARQLRKSLRKLLEFSFERMMFAHGNPIIRGARNRLEALLQSEKS